jgi:hypothetical protein
MKLPETNRGVTIGLNTLSVMGLILLTAVCWSQISPWWLTLSIPSMFAGFGLEVHLKKPQSTLNL